MTRRAVRDRAYWDQIDDVELMTGAKTVMDCSDLVDALEHLEIAVPLIGPVLDVGCGTGRVWRIVNGEYYGVDISKRAVAYCTKRSIPAALIDAPDEMPMTHPCFRHEQDIPFERIVAFSVFTHIPRGERISYLAEFSRRSCRCVVDILPGEEGGNVGKYFADDATFRLDASTFGWMVRAEYDRVSPDGVTHRYFALERR